MSSEESTSVKVPVFNGDEKNFQSWWIKFQAYARVKGFHQVLTDAGIAIDENDIEIYELKEKYGSSGSNVRTSDEEKQLRLAKKNLLAMAHLTMAFGTEALLNKIASACTSEWPGGLAHRLVALLKEKCAPKDRMAGVERQRKLNKVELKAGDDPAKLFEQLKAIDNQFSDLTHGLTEDDKIGVILDKGADEYGLILANTAREKGSGLTLDDLEEAMKVQWRITKSSKSESQGARKSEFSLAAFAGKCYNCGQTGHKADKCPNKNGNKNKDKGENGSGKRESFQGKCRLCGKQGHKAAQCWNDDKNSSKRPSWFNKEAGMAAPSGSEGTSREFLLMALEMDATAKLLEDPNVFIGDTGASSDTTSSDLGFRNARKASRSDSITDASGHDLSGKTVGDVSGHVCDKFGSEINYATIKEMVHTPNAGYNLFSITKRLDDGWELKGNSQAIWIEKGVHKVVFDIKIKTPKGAIFAVYFKRDLGEGGEVAAVMADQKKKISADVAHGLMGHMNDEDGRKAITHLGFALSRGPLTKCGACAEAKARQISLPSRTKTIRWVVNPKTVPAKNNERVHVDLSSVKAPKVLNVTITKPHWRLLVDERTEMKWSDFYATKDEMVEPTCEKFERWKAAGMPVKNVRCDNGGENVKLEKRCNGVDWKLNVAFEYTARDTPQQNSIVEVGFTTIGNRGRAMMIAANIAYDMRFALYREAYTCATQLDWLVPKTLDGVTKSRVEHWCGHLPKWSKALRTWGEAGVVKVKNKTTPKLANRGVTCMFTGYANAHAEGVYRMWDPVTNRVHVSRDVVWLKRMLYRRQPTYLEVATGIPCGVRESDVVTTNTTPTVNSENVRNKNVSVKYDENGIEQVHTGLEYVDTNSGTNGNVRQERSVSFASSDSMTSAGGTSAATAGSVGTQLLTESANESGLNLSEDNLADCSQNKNNESRDSYRSMSALLDDTDESGSDKSSDDDSLTDNSPATTVTRSGRVSRAPGWHANFAALALTPAEMAYQAQLTEMMMMEYSSADCRIDREVAGIGAGLGGGFSNTNELKVMKLDEALRSDKKGWTKAVDEEHRRMVDNEVWTPVKVNDVPRGAKILTSTWACKQKASGVKRARMNGRGYEQVDGVHFDSSSVHSPVTNDISVRIVFVLGLMAGWKGYICDVRGAFLKGKLDEDKDEMYMHVPQGFEKFYPKDVVLKLQKALYGTKQAAMAFWKELLKCMKDMQYNRNGADPCIYYKWTADGLAIWVSWVDDLMHWGPKDKVESEKTEVLSRFDCDDVGDVKEYVGCRVDMNENEGRMKLTQPVLLQSFRDEFKLTTSRVPKTPAEAGTVLVAGSMDSKVGKVEHTYYRKGTGKLLHMTRWSRPEVQNAVRELARQGAMPTMAHVKAMHRAMEYCVATPDRGWLLSPRRKWDGKDREFKFRIHGVSDSDYAKCPVSRRSVSGYSTFLEGTPVTVKSAMQKVVALSVTEAETIAGVQCAQDMMYVKRVLEGMGLQVELPMVLSIDNSGAVDLANNWAAGGRTRHMETRMFFLRELKEAGILLIKWLKGSENPVDLFTKNLSGPAFEKCARAFVGEDKYMHGKK